METSKPHLKHMFLGLCGLAALFIIWSVMPVSQPIEDFREDATGVIPEPVIVENEADDKLMADIRAEDEKDGELTPILAQDSTTENLQDNQTTEVERTETVTKVTYEKEQAAEETEENLLKIVVVGPTWLELKKGDTALLVSKVYDNGFEYVIPNEKGLRITVGRPHNVKFMLKGQELPVVSVMKRKNVSLDEFIPIEEQE